MFKKPNWLAVLENLVGKYRIGFSAKAGKCFARLRGRNPEFWSACRVIKELRYYIDAHEHAGIRFDSEGQEIVIEDGLVLTLCKRNGIWKIVSVKTPAQAIAYSAILVWKLIARGARRILTQVIVGWHVTVRKTPPLPV